MKLSILIATLPHRFSYLERLLARLVPQVEAARDEAELLVLMDNKQRSVYDKCNDLVSLARGKYVSFIGDDDLVAEDYVASILSALSGLAKTPPDAVCFDVDLYRDGEFSATVRYGIELPMEDNWPARLLTRPVMQIMAVLREHYLDVPFPSGCWRGGDIKQAMKMRRRFAALAESGVPVGEARIGKCLYTHLYRSQNNDCNPPDIQEKAHAVPERA